MQVLCSLIILNFHKTLHLSKNDYEKFSFLGYHLTELKVLTLDDFLYIDNHRKHGAESMASGIKELTPMMTKFFRKGKVGDWKNYIKGENEERWSKWINENIEGTGIKIAYEIE